MTESKKEQVYQIIHAQPFVSQQELAERLQLSRSAVAGHIASLIREKRLLGRAYVFPQSRPVVCIGGANIDRKVRTLGALQMGTSNPVSQHESFGGVARNIAENLARLGLPSSLICATGDDAAGADLLRQARAAGIDTSACLTLAGQGSGSYTAVLDADGDMLLALAHMQLCEQLDVAFLSSRQTQRSAALMTVADLNLPKSSIEYLQAEAIRCEHALILVAVSQPKMNRLPANLQGVRLLMLNRAELETRTVQALITEDEIRHACRLLQAQGAQDVMVTLGAAGVMLTDGPAWHQLAAPVVAVQDVTGAGDAFAAAVCWSLCQDNADMLTAAQRGLHLAALTLQSAATVCPDLTPDTLTHLTE
ncbi:PfkB family carbohydrate kinase [Undibacterium sp. Jales W-56]|uniref:carbohydrate kinase family protein n=1 Tax=Undibacterium sp. Jales W-56 TaxID=2897325 RepID=UPI0021D23A57|nr:PfkB family carbohydrate kinase [Undibacterium sp. Jales W-56]MCU6434734.1 PfkB family carbohydrate kinase [Undibacterium sp. Jales W-56]